MPLIDGRKVVAAAGTAEKLSSTSVAIRSVTITAETDNTGIVVVGSSSVIAALATREGTPLNAGDTMVLEAVRDAVDDLNQVWLDATVSGDGVTFSAGVL